MSKKYVVKIAGLAEGTHKFEFQIDGKLFEEFEVEEVSGADLFLNLTLDKSEKGMMLQFKISGELEVACDRCLEAMTLPINIKEEYYVAFGEKNEELDESSCEVPRTEQFFDLSKLIYEYVMLAKPMRCVHGEAGNKQHCSKEMSDMLEMSDYREDGGTDPRWDALRQINIE